MTVHEYEAYRQRCVEPTWMDPGYRRQHHFRWVALCVISAIVAIVWVAL